jgi:hypothetical protein
MSNIVNKVFAAVCLDERITDGIFKMDNEEHMNALREYFVKKGIPREAAIRVTNRMIEGKYPDRQAWRTEDGILVTFPTPQHKAKAMATNPGKYTDKDPAPNTSEPPKKEAPPGSVPEPGEKPTDKSKIDKEEPTDEEPPEDKKEPTIFQGDQKLDIEPPSGKEPPKDDLKPTATYATYVPDTPERIAAKKEVVKQIMKTDDTALTNVANPISALSENCRYQLNELYKKADELGFDEAVTFLTPYVKS